MRPSGLGFDSLTRILKTPGNKKRGGAEGHGLGTGAPFRCDAAVTYRWEFPHSKVGYRSPGKRWVELWPVVNPDGTKNGPYFF